MMTLLPFKAKLSAVLFLSPLQADKTDYSSWPVKELRRFLTERGVVSLVGSAACNGVQAFSLLLLADVRSLVWLAQDGTVL